MSVITAALLTHAKAAPAGAALYAGPLAAACDKRGVVSQAAVSALLAQMLNESAGLTRVIEDTFYTSAVWLQRVFSSHFPTVASAGPYTRDAAGVALKCYGGWQGHGLGQLTGLDNCSAYAADVGRSVSDIQAYLLTPEGAADSAVWFFVWRGCQGYAERGDLLNVTRRWEGGQNPVGWISVRQWAAHVAAAFGSAAQPAEAPQPTADALMDQFNPPAEGA